MDYPSNPIYSYATVAKEVRISVILFHVLTHITHWARPERQNPHQASREYKLGFDMQDEVADAWLPIERDEDEPENTDAAVEERDQKVDVFVTKLRELIRSGITPWTTMKRDVRGI